MFKNISKQIITPLALLIVLAVVIPGCTGQNSNSTSGDWQIEYAPAQNGKYAAVHVFNSKTGAYSQLYANEGKWKTNPNFPSVTTSIPKGNLRMQYIQDSELTLPGLNVYSATTGDWIQYYLQDKKWIQNPNFPQPKITIPKGNLDITFYEGSLDVLPTLTASCTKTKQFQMFYLDGGEWKINTAFPTGTKL